MTTTAVRGTFLDFVDDPWKHVGDEAAATRFVHDGLLVVEDGIIADFGPYPEVAARRPDAAAAATVIADRLILPGFVDGHIHVPQTRILGAYGEQLLPWLQKWVFPEERKYFDPEYAIPGIERFFDNLLASGTTSCQAFTTAKRITTELVFEEAARRDMRIIAGVTAIDQHAPDWFTTTPEQFVADSRELIARYHGVGRSLYAITPRFAYGASVELLEACRLLKQEHPDMHVHTHISENPSEVRGATQLHPDCTDYLGIYEKFDLVGPRFTGGHGVWITNPEYQRLHDAGAALTFCPCSNLYLGSGLFRLGRAKDPVNGIRLTFGTDMGGGNRFSMIHVLDDAYKVGMLNNTLLDGSVDPVDQDLAESQRNKLNWARAFYSITLGGAHGLYLDDRIGNFDLGKEADFVALDWTAGPPGADWHASLLWDGTGAPDDLETVGELLFAMMAVGDERVVAETWVAGRRRYRRDGA
ncbi:MAG: guanine deaminase [Micrococcales bacterium 73-13]|nr:MAG: guanine deaminase [Micrococcales bacterium 73-13]